MPGGETRAQLGQHAWCLCEKFRDSTLCEDEEAAESSFYSSGTSAWMVVMNHMPCFMNMILTRINPTFCML